MITDTNYNLAGFDLDNEPYDYSLVPYGYKVVLISSDKKMFNNPKQVDIKEYPKFLFVYYVAGRQLRDKIYYYECKIKYPGLCN